MKTPRPRIHLLVTSEPLTSYSDLSVRCGVVLKHAEPKWMFTSSERPHELSRLSMCTKCLMDLVSESQPETRRYYFGLADAQESKDAELEE